MKSLTNFEYNIGLNGTLPIAMCTLPNLTSIVVSSTVPCPTNCSGKCIPSVEVSNAFPSKPPMNSIISNTTANSSLNKDAVIGIVVGSFLFLIVLIAIGYYLLYLKQQGYNLKKKNPIFVHQSKV